MSNQTPKDREFIAVIGDEDSITGLLLAGIGHVNQQQKKNFLVVDSKTPTATIEATFQEFTERKDTAILLINQHVSPPPLQLVRSKREMQEKVADRIRLSVDRYQAAFPALLEIPSKDHPYDPSKDSVLKRVQKLRGD